MPLLREPRNLDGMLVSLEEKRKFSPEINKFLVAANFSYSDEKRIDQGTRSWPYENLEKNFFLSLSSAVFDN